MSENKARDIFGSTDMPEEAVTCFRAYQKHLGREMKWHQEKNGRFAQNFKYYMLQGLNKAKYISDLDLIVEAAILLSEHENYFRYVSGEEVAAEWAHHELSEIQKTVRSLAAFMAHYGPNLCWPLNLIPSKARQQLGLRIEDLAEPSERKTTGQYLAFFCQLPGLWGNN
jgi:hypothetical protein